MTVCCTKKQRTITSKPALVLNKMYEKNYRPDLRIWKLRFRTETLDNGSAQKYDLHKKKTEEISISANCPYF